MDVKKYIQIFLWNLKVDKRLSTNSFKSYEYDLKIFYDWLTEKQLNLRSKGLVFEFYDYLKDFKGNLEVSITRKIHLLLRFLKFCKDKYDIDIIIPDKKRAKVLKTYRTFMENEDLNKIREFLSAQSSIASLRLNCIVEVLYSTGCRVSELLALKKLDLVDIKKNKHLKIHGKGGVLRAVFFSEKAIESLDLYLGCCKNNSDLMFPITRQRVFQLLKNIAKTLDIPLEKIFPHSFRHRLLTDLTSKGMNLINVQKVAGHKQISTTERYTHVEDYLYEEILKYHPLAKKKFD